MSGDFDPRDVDSRERDDGIHDREDRTCRSGVAVAGSPRTWTTSPTGSASPASVNATRAIGTDDRELNPRDVFACDLDLPHSRDRELVHGRDRDYTLNGSETRTLATVGAFRVVWGLDVRDPREGVGNLRHLEDKD